MLLPPSRPQTEGARPLELPQIGGRLRSWHVRRLARARLVQLRPSRGRVRPPAMQASYDAELLGVQEVEGRLDGASRLDQRQGWIRPNSGWPRPTWV